ncbi:MAG TPA: RNB domain-containing ribonuclease [Nocardioides sp.]|uniref:RNB domain-containing ribonuclease n=1 Tax=Nocardioides sp. TaxID=35761 RepID=UPI002C8E343B|nr:RNB domain-containing ribonuclease [Nocardioides sp.]HQR28295.1 RNB domain-containing ribonuclease [Nocardioides sp.]
MAGDRVVRIRRLAEDGVQARSLRRGIAAIQHEQEVTPQFDPAVESAAASAAEQPRLPALDRTDLELVTIDPAGSRDLDQAVHVARDGRGYLVTYAIADVAAFVSAGDPVDVEAHRRGQTFYGADSKIPLHPTVLSEDAASLLPDRERPALVWSIRVDADGEGTDVDVRRALVRSRAQLDYPTAQRGIDDRSAPESLQLLAELGRKRLVREAARGGVSLPLPEQEVDIDGGEWRLEFRSLLPVEQWNAQISLLCGFAAAWLMVPSRVGLLRTLPPPDPRDVARLHRTARALHIRWPADQAYPDFIRSLDPGVPAHAAMVVACTRLLRGSGYAAFHGDLPELLEHSALTSPYSHVTAPLRRLADRYAGEVCVALCAGTAVPDWVMASLDRLPEEMRESTRRANQYENAILNLVETGILQHRVGAVFDAVVVDVDPKDERRGEVTIQEPAVEASVTGAHRLPLGEEVRVRLVKADLGTRTVEFRVV